jgi:hypothetical protein
MYEVILSRDSKDYLEAMVQNHFRPPQDHPDPRLPQEEQRDP